LGSILHNIANITQYYKFNITQYSKATKTRFFSSICVNIHQYYMPKSIFLNIHQYYLSNLQMRRADGPSSFSKVIFTFVLGRALFAV
jgi:hypothetical protein